MQHGDTRLLHLLRHQGSIFSFGFQGTSAAAPIGGYSAFPSHWCGGKEEVEGWETTHAHVAASLGVVFAFIS